MLHNAIVHVPRELHVVFYSVCYLADVPYTLCYIARDMTVACHSRAFECVKVVKKIIRFHYVMSITTIVMRLPTGGLVV